VLIAQSVAEVWKAEGPEGLENRFQAYGQEGGSLGYTMDLDKSGNPCEKEKAVFDVKADIAGLGHAEVTVSKNGKRIYTLTVTRHVTQQ